MFHYKIDDVFYCLVTSKQFASITILVILSIGSHKIFQSEKVFYSLSPAGLLVSEKIILLCFVPEGIVRNVQEWTGEQMIQRVARGLHFRLIFVAQVYSSIV